MKVKVIVILSLLLLLPMGIELAAQCPMCRMAAESNLDHGGTEGRGLNTGILYLFSMPYLIIGVLGFLWWKNKTGNEDVTDS